eukprot:1465788-Amphidinium_carterae.1
MVGSELGLSKEDDQGKSPQKDGSRSKDGCMGVIYKRFRSLSRQGQLSIGKSAHEELLTTQEDLKAKLLYHSDQNDYRPT